MSDFPFKRINYFYALLIIGFLLLIGRLFELQIILGARYRALAEENRIKKEITAAPRGMIYDRNHQPLVKNEPIYRLRKKGCEEIIGDCFQVITREEALRIETAGGEQAERLRLDVGRDYLYGRALAHVLGYLGEANEEEVEKGEWKLGDLVGRTGIEEEYEEILRGQDGGAIYEVDTLGNKVREIGKVESFPGRDLDLSIDARLSKVAYEALESKKGAVVVTEAKTGQVMVLVSSPAFDPNHLRLEDLTDEEKPMFNRAISGHYPPGSTFKVVTAVAGLEEGKVDEETRYEDVGFIQIGEYIYKNWYYTQYGRTEGEIDLVKAIKRSTDTFFYKVGEWVGANKLAEWGKAFGMGRETEIDLSGEITGLVPTPEWKEKTMGEKWFLGNTYHFAIGQADLLTTPLQVNMMTSIIANQGKLCSPKIKQEKGQQCQDLNLKPETLKLVKEGMKEACATGGTAFPFFDFSPQVGCKTGTAEFGDPEGRTHAWLTAFAPVNNPEIVVTVLVEAGGEGSQVAAPIVKEVMEAWFKTD
jgi:penicillin-binding protein 2